MCVDLKMEDEYGFCFDKFRTDLGEGWETTIQAYLLENGIVVNDEGEFGRKFLDLLEQANTEGLISPLKY